MKHYIESPYLVPFKGNFKVKDISTKPPEAAPERKECKKRLGKLVDQIDDLQQILYAHNQYSILLIFQAMDAAGKDSTIRAVSRGVNPAGFEVHSFGKPSDNELEHDFLWRTAKCLPQRGRIGVFNRSYYEEVLIVRVHPEILNNQRLPQEIEREDIWQQRFNSIIEHERHLHTMGR